MGLLSARTWVAGLAVLGSLAFLAACGGGGGDESTGSLTKAQFLEKANAICVKGNEEMGKRDVAFWKAHGGSTSDPSQALVNDLQLTVMLPVRRKELRQIRALGLPRGDDQRVEKMLLAWEEGIEKGEEEPRSLNAPGPEYAFYRAYAMGIDYGLEKCWLS